MQFTKQTKESSTTNYVSLTPLFMLQLAAPHTWPAAILPVLLSCVFTVALGHSLSIIMTFVLLIICILMQSAVNTLNDYYDFVKGTDTEENQDDPTDAVLVYNKVNPRSVFILACAFIVCAFLLGCYVVWVSGWVPLVIGLLGAAIIVLYSAGKTPLSYLPLGEYISAITMGGLIPLACFYSFTQELSVTVFLLSIPVMCGIGLIMFTNNTCDIEKDIKAGRKTQAVVLGRPRARIAYRSVMAFWTIAIIILVAVFFTPGLIVLPFMLLILYPAYQGLAKNPLTPETRGPAMGACLNLNIALGVFYFLAILIGSYAYVVM